MTSTECRPGCAACCIAPSISSPIPGMPRGKAAGVACAQLSGEGMCSLFGRHERPSVCVSLAASPEMCGSSREEALAYLAELERATAPSAGSPVSPAEPAEEASRAAQAGHRPSA